MLCRYFTANGSRIGGRSNHHINKWICTVTYISTTIYPNENISTVQLCFLSVLYGQIFLYTFHITGYNYI